MALNLSSRSATYNKTRGLKFPPQGCKISPCNFTISIEPNFATFDEITLVKSIKYNLKWPKNGPDMAPI